MTTPIKELTLREYFETVYAPSQIAECDSQKSKNYRTAINSYEKFCGAPAPLVSISEATRDKFIQWLGEQGRTTKTAVNYMAYVRAVLRHALPAHQFEKFGQLKRRWGKSKGTLYGFFRDDLCKNEWSKLSQSSIGVINTHVNHFCAWAGRDVLLSEVTAEMIQRFREDESKLKPHTQANIAASSVLRVARMIPGTDIAPVRSTGERPWRGASSDVDNPLAIAHVYANQYQPAVMFSYQPHTFTQYRIAFSNFQDSVGRTLLLSDLSDENAGRMLQGLIAKGLSPRTVNNQRAYLLVFWKFCNRRRLVDTWPHVADVPVPERIPRAWTREQFVKLFESFAKEPGQIAGIPAGIWWTTLVSVLWDTGERIGAVLQARWDCLDIETGELEIQAQHRKGGRKAMLYQLKPATIERLKEIVEPTRKLIFPFPLSIDMYYQRYTRALKRAGLPHGRHDKTHKIRRTFATYIEAAGGNATEALRHGSRALTEKSYIDPRIARKEPANKLLFDIPLGDTESDAKGDEA